MRMEFPGMGCRWRCKIDGCTATGASRTPVRAWEIHCANTHGTTTGVPDWVPPGWTEVPAHLTPIRSIFHGVVGR